MQAGRVMDSGRLYCGTALLIAILLLSLTSLFAALSAGQEDSDALFPDDRVVTVRITMSEEDWAYTRGHATDEEYVRADFSYDGVVVPDVAVRPKGYSSLVLVARERSSSHRYSLKVDFNFFNSARTLHGVKKVNLNNGFRDPSLIREAASYQLFSEMGIAAPRTAFVDLWVNDSHLGVYTMVEQIDKTFLSAHFDDSTGNLYKPMTPGGLLDWTRDDILTPLPAALASPPMPPVSAASNSSIE